jgi:uncharacterized peroxidase-related enzyme
MTQFSVHTIETAPSTSARQLEQIQKNFGFIPNLAGVLAEAPAALESYFSLGALFDKTSLSKTERQVVLLAVSRENRCHYCMAAHSVSARKQSVPEPVIDSIRNDDRIGDAKLEALRRFTTAMVRKRGMLNQKDLEAFFGAGYSRAHVLEVVLGVAMKTISNYTNHIAATPLDDAFASAVWSESSACACSACI